MTFFKTFTINGNDVIVIKDAVFDDKDKSFLPTIVILAEIKPEEGVDSLEFPFETFEQRDIAFNEYSKKEAEEHYLALRECVLDAIEVIGRDKDE